LDIILLGSSGYIGKILLKSLKKKKVQVRGFSSSDLDLTSENAHKQLISVSKENTVLVIATRAPGNQGSNEMFKNEVSMGKNISKLLESSKVKKCIYLSTVSVYDDNTTNMNITEDSKTLPSSLYGKAKLKNEATITQICTKKNIEYVILRCCKIYGPNDRSFSYGPSMFIKSILINKDIAIYGDGDELRDYLYESDLVFAINKFIKQGNSGIYNISSGDPLSFTQIIESLKKYTSKKIRTKTIKRTKPKIDQKIDSKKLTKEFKEISFTPIKKGIQETFESYKLLLKGNEIE
tara:strand:- start:1968 stop:2846 length:879 start_codon:yes stop_codon:yes gene_type:complete